jgi:ribonuclease HI
METMRKARAEGALGAQIQHHGVTLTNASGQAMHIHGVFWLRMRIVGKEINEPVIVLKEMSGEAIIGQNIIHTYGLAYDPIRNDFVFRPPQRPNKSPSWKQADLLAISDTAIEPGTSRLISCALFDKATGERLPPGQDFISAINGAPIAATSDPNGIATFYVPNAFHEPMYIVRSDNVGYAEHIDEYYIDTSPTSTETVSAIMAAASKEMEDGEDAARKLSPLKRRLINEAIQRSNFPRSMHKSYFNLLATFADIISESPADLGHSRTVVHDVKLTDDTPVYTKQYSLPREELQVIHNHVKDWLATGVIERSNSKYNSAIFCVRKKEGNGLRVVLDYRKLNAKSLPDRYSIRGADQLIMEIGKAGGRIFSTVDLRSSFWQMDLAVAARPLTAFTLMGEGQFQWKRAAQGLQGCPASFSRLIEVATRGLDNTVSYVDDLLTFSKSHSEHLEHLTAMFSRLRQHNLKVNLDKCTLGSNETTFLGHTLTPDGVTLGPDKSMAIRDCKPPSSTKTLKSFLGLANAFRNYIGHFARKSAPLYKLTRQDADWKKGQLPKSATDSFDKIRKELSGRPLLAYPNETGRFHLYIDGALGSATDPGGLGAVLLQEQPDGTRRPIGFASRQLQKHEANYTAFLIELQAACFAIEFFSIYLRPNPFTLHSDHRPMSKLSTVHTKTLNRLQRMMADFNFDIEWIQGKENIVADYLSRNAVGKADAIAVVDTTPATLAKAQAEDGPIQEVRRAIMSGDNRQVQPHWKIFLPQMQLKNDILVIQLQPRRGFMDRKTWKAVLPTSLREDILKQAHSSLVGGHSGILKTCERIRDDFWWPGMDTSVDDFIKKCTVCQQNTSNRMPAHAPEQTFELPTEPGTRVHVDTYGPMKTTDGTKAYVLVLTDAFTKYVVLEYIADKNATTTAEAILRGWIYKFGTMKHLISDGGLEYCNNLQDKLWELMDIRHDKTAPYWPRTNGQVEVFNKTMTHYLRTAISEANKSTLEWQSYLAPLAFSYNTAVSRAIKMSPFRCLFAYDPRPPLWSDLGVLLEKDYDLLKTPRDADYLHEWGKNQRQTRAIAHANNQHDQEIRRTAADRATNGKTAAPEYHADQDVWAFIHEPAVSNKKLGSSWEKATIVRRRSETTFLVRRLNQSRRKLVTLNARHLKPRISDDTDDAAASTPRNEDDDEDAGNNGDDAPPDAATPHPDNDDDNDDRGEKDKHPDTTDDDITPTQEERRRSARTRRVPDRLIQAIAAIIARPRTRPQTIEAEIRKETNDIITHAQQMQRKLQGCFQPPFSLSLTAPGPAGRTASEADAAEFEAALEQAFQATDSNPSSSPQSSWEDRSSEHDSEDINLQDIVRRVERTERNIERVEHRTAAREAEGEAAARATRGPPPEAQARPPSPDWTAQTPPPSAPPVADLRQFLWSQDSNKWIYSPETQLPESPPPGFASPSQPLHASPPDGDFHTPEEQMRETPPQAQARPVVPSRRQQETDARIRQMQAQLDFQRLNAQRQEIQANVDRAFGTAADPIHPQILQQCVARWGPAPFIVRRLGTNAEALWHKDRLTGQYPQGLPQETQDSIYNRLRSQIKGRKYPPK